MARTNKKQGLGYQKREKPKPDIHNELDFQVKRFANSLKKDIEQIKILSEISSQSGQYQPSIAEDMLKTLNFNPFEASTLELERWLLNPHNHERELRGLSHFLEFNVGQYKKLMWYYNTIKAFNYQLLPADGSNENIVSDTDYLNSYNTCLKALSKMNIKNNIPKMDLNTLENGASFYWIEEINDVYNFIELPIDYCYITGTFAYGWTGCINLMYFDKMVGFEDMIPELSCAYKTFIQERKKGLRGEELAPFQYFPLPLDKSWILTCDPNKAVKVPFIIETAGAALDVLSYRQLLKDQSLLDLWKVFASKIPLDKNNKMTMSYDAAADMVAVIQSLLPENMATFATPFGTEPIAVSQVNTLDKMVDLGDKNYYSGAGVQSGLFGQATSSAKAYTIGMNIDFEYCSKHMYSQFNNMISWLLALKTKTHKWVVKFEGNSLDRDIEIQNAHRLVTTANYPISYLVAKTGYEPFEFANLVRLENELGIKDLMKPLVSQFQQGSNSEDTGRPEKGNQVEDAGEKSREYKDDLNA